MIEGRHFRGTEGRRKTLADAIDRYLEEEVPKKKDGGMYKAALPWWKARIGHLKLADVTPAVLAEQRGKLAAESFTRTKPASKRSLTRNQKAWPSCGYPPLRLPPPAAFTADSSASPS